MRLVCSLGWLLVVALLAHTQEPGTPESETRFGIPLRLKTYPQDTAKKALASAIAACEKPDLGYLLAHLLDPGFVELRIGDRAKQFEAAVEIELANLRDFQNANPDKFPLDERVPKDRAKFTALIVQRSRERAFKQLIRDVEQKLLEDPQSLKDMKRILRDGVFTDEPNGAAKATHPDVKNRALYFKKIGDRWFLENRQEDAPQKPPV
jgi:hypothetical protein